MYLNPEEAEAFKFFCRLQEQFQAMQQAKVFEIVQGSATLNFGAVPGKIMSIRGDLPMYKWTP